MQVRVFHQILLRAGIAGILLLVAGCSSQPSDRDNQQTSKTIKSAKSARPSKVEPQKIQIEAPNQGRSSPTSKPQVIEKDLFNIEVTSMSLKVNSTPVKNLKALEKILAAYQKPVLTLAAHICMSAAQTTEIMTLAQSYTDSPIAYGSFGDYEDPECNQ